MTNRRALFSWSKNQLNQPEETFRLLRRGGMNTIFQHITKQDSEEHIRSFLIAADFFSIEVYFLIGSPEWALNSTDLIKDINRINRYSEQVRGVVIDVEPYALREFAENPQKIMASFVENMKRAYQATDLEVILCLPYFFDQLGYVKELEQLIGEACDTVAVMNYYRGKESEHIQKEAGMCLRYQKPLYTIYELQKPGLHGIRPENTYYHLGIKAAALQFEQLLLDFPNQDLRVSFHEYHFFKKLLDKEGMK